MNMTENTFPIVFAAVPPPGSFQTATAIARMIATLRRFLSPSDPTEGPRLDELDRRLGVVARRSRNRSRGIEARPHGIDRLDDLPARRDRRSRLGREPVADAEVRVDVA